MLESANKYAGVGLQRLPNAEQLALIEVAVDHGLKRSDLKCKMTRQQGEGRGRFKQGRGMLSGQEYGISYNPLLCEYCGNLERSMVCPHKAAVLRAKLLNA